MSKHSTNPFDDDDDDTRKNKGNVDDYDEDEADDIAADLEELESMDIDNDFACWESFRASLSIKKSTGKAGAAASPAPVSGLTKAERDDIAKWAARAEREEVYSRYYRPVPREKREMDELAAFLGVGNESAAAAAGGGGGLIRGFTKAIGIRKENDANLNVDADEAERRPAISTLLYPSDAEPKSILLKRGPVLLRVLSSSNNSGMEEERELILCTHGFIVATVATTPPSAPGTPSGTPQTPASKGSASSKGESPKVDETAKKPNSGRGIGLALPPLGLSERLGSFGKTVASAPKKLIRRNYESATMLTSVNTVQDRGICLVPNGGKNYDDSSFAISCSSGEIFVFTCASSEHAKAWLDAFGFSVVHHKMHVSSSDGGNGGQREIGWQHAIVQRSLYSAAVLGDYAMLQRILSSTGRGGSVARKGAGIDDGDQYGGAYTALHYATMRGELDCMSALLKAGANANCVDAENKTPIFYAERSKQSQAAHLLESYGASKTEMRDETRGELFGNAARIENNKKKDSKQSEAANRAAGKATGVAGVMSANMAALQEKQERLERLDKKTADLQNDAADYRDMAKQLKEKQKKKSDNIFGF